MAVKNDVKHVFGATDAAALAEKLGKIVSRAGKSGAPNPTKAPAGATKPGFIDASAARAAAKKYDPSGKVRHGLFGGTVAKAADAPAPRHAAPSAAQRKVADRLIKLTASNPTRAAETLGKMFKSAELGRDVRGQFVTTDDEKAIA